MEAVAAALRHKSCLGFLLLKIVRARYWASVGLLYLGQWVCNLLYFYFQVYAFGPRPVTSTSVGLKNYGFMVLLHLVIKP